MDPEQRKKKAQKLSEALAVLAIRPPSFNSLFTAGRLEQVCKLFSRFLINELKKGVFK